MGGDVSTIINLQTELNYLDSVNILKIFSVLTWSHPSTHPPTHPPNQTPTCGWRIHHRFQIFKWNWNILINSSVIKFNWFWGSPQGGGGWVDGVGVGMGVWWGVPCMYACTCMHACTCILNMINMDASMSVAICNFYTCIHVHAYACVCPCMCVHVGTPPCPQIPPDAPRYPPPPAPFPEPQGAQNTKIQ